MRMFVLVLVVVAVGGCSRRATVVIPNTPEGLACERECMSVFQACKGGRRANQRNCLVQQQRCLETCPGAMFSDGTAARGSLTQPNGTPAIAPTAPPVVFEPLPVADAGVTPKCVASESPEWAGASATRKKELLDACR